MKTQTIDCTSYCLACFAVHISPGITMSSGSKTPCHVIDLKKYHINSDTGFMLWKPLRLLPTYFEPWNDLATLLPTLMKEKTFRQAVDKLPLLNHNMLIGHRQLRLAHLQLSLITCGYVWQDGEGGVAKILPKCVAVPFCKISEQLGVKPIMSFIDLGLANYALIDPEGPYTFENLECIYHLPDRTTGDWFCIVTFMMELSFAKCLKAIIRVLELLGSAKPISHILDTQEKTTEGEIISCLEEVTRGTKDMEYSLSRMRDHLDARSFFNVIRPFLDGWGGKRNPLPEGLIYEGVSDIPVKLIGGSGAQSLTLQVLDSLLGVEHKEDKRRFLLEMRTYMLPNHRRFVEDIEQHPYPLREFVISSSNETLKSSYNKCLSALKDVRDYHIQLVKMYVVIPSRKANEGVSEGLDERGTGGTNLIPFLGDLRTATEEKLLLALKPTISMSVSRWNILAPTVRFCVTAMVIAIVGFYTTTLI